MKRIILVFSLLAVGIFSVFASGKTESTTYQNENYGFSFSYPAEFKKEPALFPDEVIRLAASNDFKVPVITASVREKNEAVELADMPGKVVEFMKVAMPDTSGYVIISEEMITLKNNVPAALIEFSWVLGDGVTTMETASIIALKDQYQITMTGNTIRGLGFPLDELTRICKTLRIQ